MKLSDIDKSLNEAPVGKLGRLANKLKKNMPFNKDMRDEAAGEEVTQLAANELWSSFNTWLGKAKASGIDPNAITVAQLGEFFRSEGFEKTALDVIQDAAMAKAGQVAAAGAAKGTEPEQPEPAKPADDSGYENQKADEVGDEEQEELLSPSEILDKKQDEKEQSEEEIRKAYAEYFADLQSESLESRLALMLFEEEGIQLPTFSKKEVEKLILKIVGSVHRENPEGLAQRVNKYVRGQDDEVTASPTPSAGATMSDDEFGRLSGLLDDFFLNFEQSMKKLDIDAGAQKKLKAAWERDKENTLWDMKKQS
jgi:hypothetical protein